MIETTTMDPCQLGHCFINGWCRCGARMLDYKPLTNLTVSAPRELTQGEMTSLERVAAYRALVGQQQSEIRRLRSILRDLRDQTAPESSAAALIEQGLEGKP